jgi:hypothetical protein
LSAYFLNIVSLFLGERIQPCFFGIGLGAGWSDSFGLVASRGASRSNFAGRKHFTFSAFCALDWKHQRSYERKKHA